MPDPATQAQLSEILLALPAKLRRETGFHAQQLTELLDRHGALETAHLLLAPGNTAVSYGFDRISDLNRPDLTLEGTILAFPARDQLFSAEELALAQQRVDGAQKLTRSRRIAER